MVVSWYTNADNNIQNLAWVIKAFLVDGKGYRWYGAGEPFIPGTNAIPFPPE